MRNEMRAEMEIRHAQSPPGNLTCIQICENRFVRVNNNYYYELWPALHVLCTNLRTLQRVGNFFPLVSALLLLFIRAEPNFIKKLNKFRSALVYTVLDQLCVFMFNGKQLFMCKQHFMRVYVMRNLSENIQKVFHLMRRQHHFVRRVANWNSSMSRVMQGCTFVQK